MKTEMWLKTKLFTYILRTIKIPIIDTKELAKIIEENHWDINKIQEQISKKNNVNLKDIKKYTLPVIAVLTFWNENEIKKSSEIIEWAVRSFWANKSSVLPSDYSVGSKFQSEEKWYLEKTWKVGEYKLSELWKKLLREINW